MSGKPRPAPIYEKRCDAWRLHFSFNGKQYRHSYIANQHTANILQNEVNHLVSRFKNGLLLIPPDASLSKFIFDSVCKRPTTAEPTAKPTITTFIELVEEYQKLSLPPAKLKSTCKTETIHLRHLQRFVTKKHHGNLLLKDITAGFFDHYKKYRYELAIRTDTVKKELGTFQVMFQMAVDHGYLAHNVVKDVKRDKSQIPSDRFRTHGEIQKLLQTGHYTAQETCEIKRFQYLTIPELEQLIALARDHWVYPVLITFAYSGMRRGEMVRLQWADVDLKARFLYARSQKQSTQRQETVRSIPIHDRLLPVLIAQKEQTGHSRWVFLGLDDKPLRPKKLNRAFNRVLSGTDFEGLGLHMFRHSLASNLAAKGTPQQTIDAILGHQTEAMRQRYRRLFPNNVNEALNRLREL